MNRSLKAPGRPDAPHPGGIRTALALAAALAGAAAAQTPLSLADAIATVKKNSDETRLIVEKSRKLDAQKTELWAGALPNVSAYANAGRGAQPFDIGSLFGPDSIVNPVQNRFSYGLQATQPIYSFGRLGNAFRTANLQIKSQDQANRRSVQELELQTLDAFYAVVMAEARIRVISASLERQTKTVGFLESNFKRGAGSRSILLLTSASLKALEPERIRAERDADAARMNLNRLLGRPEREPLTVDTASVAGVEGAAANRTVTARNLDKTVENRPDIQSLHLLQKTTEGIARAYRMQYLPALGAQGKVGILAYKADDQLADFDKNLEWQVGVGLTWPLFDGLSMSSKAKQYDSDARTLAITERKARTYARIEIESAQREAEASDTALSAAQQSRNASAEALELISQDFRAGAGTVTDLLSAEEGLRAAESGLLAARYQKVRAEAALRVALGMNLTEGENK
jgi:HAE1 family hydrophobic/amphiphilic exporter-1